MKRPTTQHFLFLSLAILALVIGVVVWFPRSSSPEIAETPRPEKSQPQVESGDSIQPSADQSSPVTADSSADSSADSHLSSIVDQQSSISSSPPPSSGRSHRNALLADLPDLGKRDTLATDTGIALGLAGSADFAERLEAVHRLGPNLPAPHLDQIFDYLATPVTEASLSARQEHALRNDLMNVLRAQEIPPENLTEALLNIRHDFTQDEVMRDYALQHLAPWYERAADFERIIILEELTATVSNPSTSLAGTALHGLHRINEDFQVISEKDFEEMVGNVFLTDDAHLNTTISATQMVGLYQLKSQIESLQEIIGSELVENTLRLAAIHALGRIGTRSDLVPVFAYYNDPFYRKAVESALLQTLNH